MKKTLVALAALAATGAYAQATISGLMDVGVVNTSRVAPGASTTDVTRGNNNRLIFSASEDMQGGLKATATAQLRFDPQTGIAGEGGTRPVFQGETRIGLSGGFGTLQLGRGLTALQAPNGGNSDPWGVTTVAGSVYAAGFASDYAAGGEGRIDRALFYTSPSISGLTVSFSWSPRKLAAPGAAAVADANGVQGTNAVTEITSANTHSSVNFLYANGPLVAGLGSETNRVGDSILQIYGNYDLGLAKVFVSNATIKGGTAADRAGVTFAATAAAVPSGTMTATTTGGVAADGKINNSTIGAIIPMGATSFRVGYSSWNGNGAAGQQTDQKTGLGVRYDLSKRTYIYADVATQTRKNNTGTRPDRDNTTVTYTDFGVAHSF